MRLMVVEDEENLRTVIRKRLMKEGYSVDACGDGQEALDYMAVSPYDTVILDIMMPKMSGMEVLKKMRAGGDQAPVLFLTAKDGIEDRVKGLDSGADDYLVKPFHIRELMARIRALTRRAKDMQNAELLSYADLQFDRENRRLTCKGHELDLSAKETDLMYTLMKQPDTTFSREQLILTVWGIDSDIAPGNVDNYISFLRKRLNELGSCCVIKTIYGTGYRLENGDA